MSSRAWIRVVTTLVAVGVAGFLLWLAAQFDMRTTGGYWAALGVVAGCGVLLGVAQLRGWGGNPPAMLLAAFLPVLVCAGWVLVYDQPNGNWFRRHADSWGHDIGIGGVVHDIGKWNGVLAFGIGLVFAYALEPRMIRRGQAEPAAGEPAPIDRAAADEPTAAVREEAGQGVTVERTPTSVR